MRYSRLFFLLFLLVAGTSLTSCKTTKQNAGNHHHSNNSNNSNNTSSNFNSTYSKELGVTLNGSEDKKLISCLAEWVGAPYKYGGNTKQGTDCSGMVFSVYKETYNIDMNRSSADQLKNVKEIDKKDLKAGDLVFFKISGDKISHVGIYLGENKFIHATTKKGVMVNDLDEEYYKKYYYTSGRVIGMP